MLGILLGFRHGKWIENALLSFWGRFFDSCFLLFLFTHRFLFGLASKSAP